MKQELIERFTRYVKVDTQSDPESNTCPSTQGQWDLARMLVEELKAIGMEEVTVDENGYVMATLPANTDKNVPTIGFLAHLDTAPEFTGTNVNPQIIEQYDGGDIVLTNSSTSSYRRKTSRSLPTTKDIRSLRRMGRRC